MGEGGGMSVRLHAFYSEDSRSNPAV